MTEQDNYWRGLFTVYKKSGLKQLEFCRENDISHSQFRYQWNKQNHTARRALKLTHPHQDHLPLYRQEKIWQRMGVEMARNTLSG